MKYHAIAEYEGTKHYWWNKSKDKIISDLMVPFINGQVIVLSRKKRKSVLNMKNVSFLSIYRTRNNLVRPASGMVPIRLIDLEDRIYECTSEILGEARIASSNDNISSFLQLSLSGVVNQVFVIMEFEDETLDSAYEGVIKPLFVDQDLNVIRADEIQDSGRISDQILENIAKSKFVFADLSGERPNCYYECGFAHALGKELILSIRKGEQIHFDMAGYRFIQWKTEQDLRRKLKERLYSIVNSENE